MTDETDNREPYKPKEPAPKPKSVWNKLSQERREKINEALRKAGISEPMA